MDVQLLVVTDCRGKLLIKPSKAAIKRARQRLSDTMRRQRGANASAVNRGLNPFIRGWAAYYRTVVSSEVFQSLDAHVWRLVYKWASFTHPKKPKRWIIDRYFGQFNPNRRDRWVFGDRDSAPTRSSSPGRQSSATRWSKLGHPPMTPHSTSTGPTGDARRSRP
ncbi:hypothetical protein JNW88_31680 [Micromonospora sp. ATA32]|nr:hypothetical protein [Micromonospora sp. ATA32]